MKKIILILICSISTGVFAQTAPSKVVSTVPAEEFAKLSAADKNGVIIDLRTTDEMNTKGFIKGAVQLDWLAKDNEAQVGKLDKNKTYYIYCAAGGRSGDCAEFMEKHNFKKVVNLDKGFSSWVKKGLPVAKK